ncbi:MAG: hypothetical protein ACLQG3_10880 [Terracidiphilus sp.]
MSKIYSALRALEQEQKKQEADADFSVLKGFTAPRAPGREPDEEQGGGERTQAGHEALAIEAGDFSALEERIVRVAELVQRERRERMAAEERALLVEAEMSEQAERIEAIERELNALISERDDRRERVGQMLAILDTVPL